MHRLAVYNYLFKITFVVVYRVTLLHGQWCFGFDGILSQSVTDSATLTLCSFLFLRDDEYGQTKAKI